MACRHFFVFLVSIVAVCSARWSVVCPARESFGHLDGATGMLSYYSDDGSYPANQDCYWTIEPKLDIFSSVLDPVDITVFFSKLSIEDCGVRQCDYVSVCALNNTGPQSQWTVHNCSLHKGIDLPKTIFFSNEKAVAVRFHSDSAFGMRGFELNWVATFPPPSYAPAGTCHPIQIVDDQFPNVTTLEYYVPPSAAGFNFTCVWYSFSTTLESFAYVFKELHGTNEHVVLTVNEDESVIDMALPSSRYVPIFSPSFVGKIKFQVENSAAGDGFRVRLMPTDHNLEYRSAKRVSLTRHDTDGNEYRAHIETKLPGVAHIAVQNETTKDWDTGETINIYTAPMRPGLSSCREGFFFSFGPREGANFSSTTGLVFADPYRNYPGQLIYTNFVGTEEFTHLAELVDSTHDCSAVVASLANSVFAFTEMIKRDLRPFNRGFRMFITKVEYKVLPRDILLSSLQITNAHTFAGAPVVVAAGVCRLGANADEPCVCLTLLAPVLGTDLHPDNYGDLSFVPLGTVSLAQVKTLFYNTDDPPLIPLAVQAAGNVTWAVVGHPAGGQTFQVNITDLLQIPAQSVPGRPDYYSISHAPVLSPPVYCVKAPLDPYFGVDVSIPPSSANPFYVIQGGQQAFYLPFPPEGEETQCGSGVVQRPCESAASCECPSAVDLVCGIYPNRYLPSRQSGGVLTPWSEHHPKQVAASSKNLAVSFTANTLPLISNVWMVPRAASYDDFCPSGTAYDPDLYFGTCEICERGSYQSDYHSTLASSARECTKCDPKQFCPAGSVVPLNMQDLSKNISGGDQKRFKAGSGDNFEDWIKNRFIESPKQAHLHKVFVFWFAVYLVGIGSILAFFSTRYGAKKVSQMLKKIDLNKELCIDKDLKLSKKGRTVGGANSIVISFVMGAVVLYAVSFYNSYDEQYQNPETPDNGIRHSSLTQQSYGDTDSQALIAQITQSLARVTFSLYGFSGFDCSAGNAEDISFATTGCSIKGQQCSDDQRTSPSFSMRDNNHTCDVAIALPDNRIDYDFSLQLDLGSTYAEAIFCTLHTRGYKSGGRQVLPTAFTTARYLPDEGAYRDSILSGDVNFRLSNVIEVVRVQKDTGPTEADAFQYFARPVLSDFTAIYEYTERRVYAVSRTKELLTLKLHLETARQFSFNTQSRVIGVTAAVLTTFVTGFSIFGLLTAAQDGIVAVSDILREKLRTRKAKRLEDMEMTSFSPNPMRDMPPDVTL